MKPIFSCIMPSYNTSQYLAEAVQTLLDQSFKDFELIVVDDASTDSSDIIMEYFVKKDPRVKYIKNKVNQGIAKTRNIGFSYAKGDYIAICDSDDIYHPDRLKLSYKALQKADICFSPILNADADGKVYAITEVPKALTIELLHRDQQIPIITVATRRRVFEDHPYDSAYRSNDDLKLIYEWYLADYTWKRISTPMVIHRHHQSSVTIRKREEVAKFGDMAKKFFEEGLRKKNAQKNNIAPISG